MFKTILQKIKSLIVEPAPKHAEQTLEEFLRDCKLPERPKEESKNETQTKSPEWVLNKGTTK
jgi:hypothetical protein